jgi:dihydrofolate synthase / folylpolyglutamate synthase
MNYTETLEFLARRGNEVQMMHLGLHRTIAMMQALGNPHEQFRSIHIAGTNGKGSVAAMVESILNHAGWKTGLYTSPHLVRVEERFRISGRQISSRAFAALATRIAAAEADLLRRQAMDRGLTTFEFLTCCAFLYFAEKKVDVAVVEVGLGGKLDSTNVIRPEVSIITGISLDHQNYLGNTLTKIAGEKAGIIKENIPIVSGCCVEAPRRVIRKRAKEVSAPLIEICDDCTIKIRRMIRGHRFIDLHTPVRDYQNLYLSLAGEHQTGNAALAVMATENLKSIRVKAQDIRRGLANTTWPGRLDEYDSCRRTLMDGAHNPEGAQFLREYLVEQKEKEVHFVFGAVRDKNIKKMGSCLFPLATTIHLAEIANSRSADPADIADMHRQFRSRIRIHPNMHEALLAAWKQCSRSGLVVVTGSLYLIGELLSIVQKGCRDGKSLGAPPSRRHLPAGRLMPHSFRL